MKKHLLLGLGLSLSVLSAIAQQKVKDGTVAGGGNLPNKDALFELESANKALLHTRVALKGTTDAFPLSIHTAGMMLYNTALTADVVPGIYYNNGTKWVLASAGDATNIKYDPASLEISYLDANNNGVKINLNDIIKGNQTVTTLVDNNNGTYTYTAEDGKTTLIDVSGDVVENFQALVNDGNVKSIIENIVKNTADNVAYDGTNLTYVDASGTKQTINLDHLVKANQTITTLVDNNNGTYTYTAEDGKTTLIDVSGDVVENFQALVNDGNVKSIIENIVKNTADNVAYDGTNLTYVDATGTKQTINLENLVKGNETVTTLVDNNNGTYTYTAEDGKTTLIDVSGDVVEHFQALVNDGNVKSIIENIVKNTADNVAYDGTNLTYVDATGTKQTINLENLVKGNQLTTTVLAGTSTTVSPAVTGNNTAYTVDVKDGGISNAKLAADAVTTDKIKDGSITSSDIAAGALTATNLGSGTATNGQVLIADGAGGVSYGNLPASSVTGQDVTASSKVTLAGTPAGAALKAFSIDVNEANLTLSNIGGKVTNAQITNGTAGQVLASTATGTNWVDLATISSDITLANGTNTTVTSSTVGSSTEYKVATNNATAAVAGAVKPGTGLTVDGTGTLSVDAAAISTGKALSSTDLSISANGATSLLKDVTVDIKPGAITNGKLADNAITSNKIQDGSITTADIAAGTISTANIGSGTATNGQVLIADGAGGVTYGNLPASSVDGKALTSTDLSVSANGSTSLLKDVTIDIKPGAITSVKLADNAITSNKIQDGSITAADIAAGTITTATIGSGTATNGQVLIADGTGGVSYGNLPASSVTGADVTAGSTKVTLAGTPAGAALKAFSVDVNEANLTLSNMSGKVTNAQISNGTAGQVLVSTAAGTNWVDQSTIVPTGKALTSTDLDVSANGATSLLKDVTLDIKAGAVTGAKIADGTITAADIAAGAITAGSIGSGAASNGQVLIADGAGGVSYGNLPASSVTGANVTAGSTKVTLGGTPAGAALKAFSVDVNEANLTLSNMSGKVTNAQISNGTAGQVLVSTATGTNWLDATTVTAEPWNNLATHTSATANNQDIYQMGWVGIGTNAKSAFADEALTVAGKIRTVNNVYADYVFEKYFDGKSKINKDYQFKTLAEVEAFLKANKHLPGVTPISKTEKTKNGYSFDLTELSIQSLEKLEELYLHVIEQNKRLAAKDAEIETLKKTMNERLEKLEKLLSKK